MSSPRPLAPGRIARLPGLRLLAASRRAPLTAAEQARRNRQAQRVFLALSIACGLVLWAWIVLDPRTGWDAHVYWSTSLANPYASSAAGAPDAYLYAPVFRQAFEPLALLSWPLFHAVWVAMLIAVVILLAGPFAIFVLANPILIFELQAGNIHVLLAAAIVFGFRYPATWAFVLLTKVTPGVGILWFMVRREWRNVVAVTAGTGLIVAVSFALSPDLWVQWIHSLAANAAIPDSRYSGGLFGPLWFRGLAATAVVTWGALTDRRWTVPVAATLAIPLLAFINLSLLVAVVPLVLPDAGRLIRRWLPERQPPTAAES